MGSQLATVFDGQITIYIVAQKFLAFLAIHFPNLYHIAPGSPARKSSIYKRNSIKVFSNHGETKVFSNHGETAYPNKTQASNVQQVPQPQHHPHNLAASALKESGRNMKLLRLILLPKQSTQFHPGFM